MAAAVHRPETGTETRSEALVIAYSAGSDEERDMGCGECRPGESLGQHGDLIPDADSTCRLVRPRQRSRITNARIGTRGEQNLGSARWEGTAEVLLSSFGRGEASGRRVREEEVT